MQKNYGAYTFALSVFLFLNTIFRFGFDIHLQKKTVSICEDSIGSSGEFLAQKKLNKNNCNSYFLSTICDHII